MEFYSDILLGRGGHAESSLGCRLLSYGKTSPLLLYQYQCLCCTIIVCICYNKLAVQNITLVFLQGAECGINADVEKQLEMGKKLLAAGQLADALSHFHAAIGM